MAYNPIFPVGYQPQQYYPTQLNANPTQMGVGNNQANTQTSLIWVQGLEAAKSYLVAPNTTVTLWDSESQTIFLKSADASGMPSMKILDYKIRDNTPQETARASHSEFATKVDVESIKKEIVALTDRVNNLYEKGGEVNE